MLSLRERLFKTSGAVLLALLPVFSFTVNDLRHLIAMTVLYYAIATPAGRAMFGLALHCQTPAN